MNNILFGTIRAMISDKRHTARAPKTGVLLTTASVVLALLFLSCADETAKPNTTDTTAPSQIGALQIIVQMNASVDITWTDPDDADFSHVLITWTPTGGSVPQPFLVARGIERATITGLEDRVGYTFSVASVDLSGNKSTPKAAPAVTATGVPPSDTDITNLSRTSSADGTVIILWVDPTGETFSHVLITWAPQGGDQSQPLRVEKGVQMATITGLFGGTDYTFSVVTVDTAETESTPTETTPVTVMGEPPSQVSVTNVTGVARTAGNAEITWTDPIGADFSHVLITWNPEGGIETQPLRIESGVQAAAITGLTDGTEYTFSVVAINTAGASAAAVTAVLTANASVNPVTGLSAVAADNSGATLSWTNPTDSDLSHILITWTPETSASQPVRIDDTGVGTLDVLRLTVGSPTTFTVQTVDTAGNTASETATVTATADMAAPADVTNLTATLLANASVELTWDDPTDSDFSSVQISWSGTADQTSPVSVNAEIETTTLTGLTAGTSYTFTVSTLDETGNQTTGETIRATPDASVSVVTRFFARSDDAGRIFATWSEPDDADFSHVNITWDPAGGDQTQPVRVDGGEAFGQVLLTGLAASTEYTLTATSVDTPGNEAPATATSFVDTSVPAVTDLMAGGTTADTIVINWTALTNRDVTHVNITWEPAGGDQTQPLRVAAGEESRVVLTGFTGGARTITVTTVDVLGNEATATATSVVDTSVPAVTGLEARVDENGSAFIKWTDPTVNDLSHVNLTWTPEEGDQTQPLRVEAGVENSGILTGLTAGMGYTVTATSVDVLGNEATATTRSIEDTSVPAVTNLMAVGDGDGRILIRWVDPTASDLTHINLTWEPAGGSQTQPLRVAPGDISDYVYLTGLTGGQRTITATSVDTLGHEATATATATPGTGAIPAAGALRAFRAPSIAPASQTTQITWVDPPASSGVTRISITGSPAPTTAVVLNRGVERYSFTSVHRRHNHTYTIKTLNSANSTINTRTVTVNAARTRPVALFGLGTRQGNFGYGACQSALNGGGIVPNTLRAAGYTKAVFFGSTSTYPFSSLATHGSALGMGDVLGDTLRARQVVTYAGATPTTHFGSGSGTTRTIVSVVDVRDDALGRWQNNGFDVVSSLIGTGADVDFWSFSTRTLTSDNCNNAGSSSGAADGRIGGNTGVGSHVASCNSGVNVLCAAH